MPPKPKDPPGKTLDRLQVTYRYLMGKKSEEQINRFSNENRQIRDSLAPPDLRQQFLEVVRVAANSALCVGELSEFSLRLPHGHFLATGKGAWAHHLQDDDLLVVLSEASVQEQDDALPAKWAWHQGIYKDNPEVGAVCFVHPIAPLALAAKDKALPDRVAKEAADLGLPEVAICKPQTSAIAEASQKAGLLVLPGIGVLTRAESLKASIIQLQKFNFWCELALRNQ